jgi:glycosyltransferase involved in cell wall biosynthesis
MKIIILCPSLKCNTGWNRYTHDIVTRLSKNAEVVVLCQDIADEVDPSIRQISVMRSAMAYLTNPLAVFFDAWRVRKAVAIEVRSSGEECIIHCTTEAQGMFIPFFKGLNAKIFMTTHGTYSVLPLKNLKTRWLYKRVYKSVDRVIAVSHYTKKHLLENAGSFLSKEKVFVMTNGVDFINRAQKKLKSDDVYRIITVGEVKNRKGGHHLVRVARYLKDQYDFNFQVTFIGNVQKQSPYFIDIQKFISEHHLEDNINFVGMIPQNELDDYYSTANLFALLSVHENGHYDGYPLVFHEAAMWGLPTIGTFNCGAEDAINDGVTGVLVHPSHHEKIANQIANIRNGKIPISADTCVQWAQENDWDKKDLLAMYTL